MQNLPTSIQLTQSEASELQSLTRFQLSSIDFWKKVHARCGVVVPASKVLMTISVRNGSYRLEYHPKRLGKSAIAAGIEYRKFTEKKDREWEAKLAKRGQQVY